jgi:stage V sporulation protein B
MVDYARQAFSGARIVALMFLLGTGFSYLIRLLLARMLTPTEFGLFYAGLAFLSLIIIFKDVGLQLSIVKFIPELEVKKRFDRIKGAILFVLGVQLGLGIIIATIIFFAAPSIATAFFHEPKAAPFLRLLCIFLLALPLLNVVQKSFRGFQRLGYSSSIEFVRLALVFVLLIPLLAVERSVFAPTIAYITAAVILSFVYSKLFITKVFPAFTATQARIGRGLIRSMVWFGLFMFISTIGNLVIRHTDVLLLTWLTDLESVALYSAAHPTANLVTYLTGAIATVMLPLSSEMWTKNKKSVLRKGTQFLIKYSFLVLAPAVVVMLVFPKTILVILFGWEFRGASVALQVLSVGAIFAGLALITVNILAGIGRPKLNSRNVIIAVIVNIACNLVLIPVLGIVGAALGTLISFGVWALLSFYHVKRYLKFRFPITDYVRILSAGIIATGVAYVLKQILVIHWLIQLGVVGASVLVVYGVLVALFGVITRDEKDLIVRTVLR